jgi:protein phosphatase
MLRPGYGIRLRSSARTNKGRVRPNNEDSIHLWGNEGYVLAVIADGMGGAVAGEEASRIAVETVHEQMVNGHFRNPDDYDQVDSDDLAVRLEAAVKRANLNIHNRAIVRPELKGMGTTITLAFARHSDVIVAHVGDSRAYLIDGGDGTIAQVTDDHSFVQALVDAGHIRQEEADEHPMKNVLYRALGQAADVDIDMIHDVRLHIGDRLVLCSDGLTLHVKPREIAALAMSSSEPDQISQKLIEMALSRGGKDNVSVIVIVVEGDPNARFSDAETLEMPFQDDDATLPMDFSPTEQPPLSPPPKSKTQPTNRYKNYLHPFNSSSTQGEGRDLRYSEG